VLAIQPAQVVLMASERLENGVETANRTPAEIVDTARRSVERLLAAPYGLTPQDLFIDVSVCPLASDTDGVLRRAVDAITTLGRDEVTRQCHLLVGLSNIGIMLPKQAVDGRPLNVTVESAFLTLTVPFGLDTILGTPGRQYQILDDNDFILRTVREAIYTEGFEALLKVQELYTRSESCATA
jgi:5-methyltetrahydrofolate--homocysteine methyltransferase